MNTLANIPRFIMKFLQSQNVKRNVVKQFDNSKIKFKDSDHKNDSINDSINENVSNDENNVNDAIIKR